MKRPLAPLEAGPVRLRLLQEADLPQTLAWRNQPHIRRWFFNSEALQFEQHLHWFTQYRERDDDFMFIIEAVELAYRPVGQVALYHIDWSTLQAEFGRLMIGEAEATGRGLALAATQAVIQIAFGQLGLEQLYLEVFGDNIRAIRIYELVGFVKQDGQAQLESGQFPGGATQRSILRMALHRSDRK